MQLSLSRAEVFGRRIRLPGNFATNFSEIPSTAIANREGRLRIRQRPRRDPLMQSSPTTRKLFSTLFGVSCKNSLPRLRRFLLVHGYFQ